MTEKHLPTTSYAVLGLLSRGPASRYDLANFAEVSIANFWTIAKSQVYGELERLEKLGYVKGKDVRQKALPDKRIFELTSSGRQALKLWMADPSFDSEKIRSGFLVKLFFAHEMPPDVLEQMVRSYRDRARHAGDQLRAIVAGLGRDESLVFMRATAEFGIRIELAVAEWADELLRSVTRKKPRAASKTVTGGKR